MTIFEPKVINLGNEKAITGDKTLIFAEEKEYAQNKAGIDGKVKKTFDNLDYEGLCCRADPETLSVTFLPTMRCNLRCIYCYADGGFSNADLNEKDSFYVIDQLMRQYPEARKINIFFAGGGEPLLNFKVMEKIVEYVKDKNLSTYLRTVSNGTLVPEHIDWLKSNNVYLRISYDGSSQSRTRPGVDFDSQKRLMEVFDLLKREYPSELLTSQTTVTSFNIDTLPNDVLYLIRQGINAVKIEAVHSSLSSRSKQVDQPYPEHFAAKLLEVLDVLVENKIKAYIDTSHLSLPGVSYFCALRNKIIVSPYGVLGSCVENIVPDTDNNLILWKLNRKENIDFQKIRDFQKQHLFHYYAENYKICSNCNLVHMCKSNCPMRLILNKQKEGPYSYTCKISHKLIPEFLKKAAHNEDYLRLVFGDNFSVEEKCD